MGELVIETFIQQETILTQGFHQEDYHITQIIETNNHNISIYPNPTKNIINKLGNEAFLNHHSLKMYQ